MNNTAKSLGKNISLSSGEYQDFKNELVRLIEFKEAALLEDRLIAGAVWIDILVDFIGAMAPSVEHGKTNRNEVLSTFFTTMTNQQYARPLGIAQKTVPKGAIKRLFLSLLIAFRTSPETKRSNIHTLFFILSRYAKAFFKTGKIRLLPHGMEFPFSALKKISFNYDEKTEEIIREWVIKYIREDKLLEKNNIKSGYIYLLLQYSIMKWYAVSLAWESDKKQADFTEVEKAISLVDQYYMFHPELDILFKNNPVLADIMAKVLSRKTAPMILVRS